jgi:hypothetical protein
MLRRDCAAMRARESDGGRRGRRRVRCVRDATSMGAGARAETVSRER